MCTSSTTRESQFVVNNLFVLSICRFHNYAQFSLCVCVCGSYNILSSPEFTVSFIRTYSITHERSKSDVFTLVAIYTLSVEVYTNKTYEFRLVHFI